MTYDGDFRLSHYVIHHSTPVRKGCRSRAALLVTAGLPHSPVDLSAFTTEKAEFVAASIRVLGNDFTVISAYVAPGPNNSWGAEVLCQIARQCPGHLILCGDFNAHHSVWGGCRNTSRGKSLDIVTSSLHLEALNDGTPSYVRRGVNDSVLDLTFASPDVAANWTTQADSCLRGPVDRKVVHMATFLSTWSHRTLQSRSTGGAESQTGTCTSNYLIVL